jgi:hypothetical protein
MAERVVHHLEAVEVQYDDGERLTLPVGKRNALTDAIVHQDPVRKTGEHIVRRQMAQLLVRGFESMRPRGDHFLESFDLMAHHAFILPFARQCVGRLHDLDGLKGLLDHQQLIGIVQPGYHVGPVAVGVGGADHDLHVRVDGPKMFDRFQPVPARRHAHIHESHRIGPPLIEGLLDFSDAFLALICRVDLEAAIQGGRRRFAEEREFGRGQAVRVVDVGTEHLAEIGVNCRVVVDDEDASVDAGGDFRHKQSPELLTVSRE